MVKPRFAVIAILAMAYAQTSLAGRIHELVIAGDLEGVQSYLDTYPGAVNEKDDSGKSPLHLASKYDRTRNIANLLLERGAKVNQLDGKRKTPLHWALYYGSFTVTELLLQSGANVNAVDCYGRTPLSEVLNPVPLRILGRSRSETRAISVRALIAYGAGIGGAGVQEALHRQEPQSSPLYDPLLQQIRALLTPEGIAQIHRDTARQHTAEGRHRHAAVSHMLSGDHRSAASSLEAAEEPGLAGASYTRAGDHGAAAKSHQGAMEQALIKADGSRSRGKIAADHPLAAAMQIEKTGIVEASRQFKKMCESFISLARAHGVTSDMLKELSESFEREAQKGKAAFAKAVKEIEANLVKTEEGPRKINLIGLVLTEDQSLIQKRVDALRLKLGQAIAAEEALEAEAAAVRAAIATARAALPAP